MAFFDDEHAILETLQAGLIEIKAQTVSLASLADDAKRIADSAVSIAADVKRIADKMVGLPIVGIMPVEGTPGSH